MKVPILTFFKPQVNFSSNFSWLFTPLQIFRSNVIYFAQKGSIKVKLFRLFSAWIKINEILVIFETKYLQILHHSSASWDITPLYLFSWNFICFQQKEPIKVQIWWNFTWAVESLKFCTVVGSFCKNQIKFQLKKYRRLISHDIEEWCKV